MKKTIIALAAAGAASFAQAEVEGLSASATFGFESEYVFRGVKLSQNAFQSSMDVSYMGAYAGIWTSFAGMDGSNGGAPQGFPPGTVSTQGSEVDYYAGYAMPIDMATLDFGVTAYTYPDAGGSGTFGGSDTLEIYFGAGFDVVANPAAYIYYDFNLEVFTLELSASHSVEVYENTSLDFGGAVGFQTGDNWLDASGFQVDGERYYWSLTADAVYALAENASVQIGPRLGGFGADHGLPTPPGGSIKPDATYLWWGASFTAGF